ncbi:MAG: 4-(cytidine 5'-diphospho)-2-C-methyl-D-erythritol kinase [Candidatus Margulisbacteria bacterium]|nr:4-(cytidine 5'-diphospho)-2-C-methyl-D-erythritol kinase [Candidatus Margulisiibacteriota bacterium]MBU1616984.1 4-(cytidine 5'-diphospho)-2-C-methyl-D-erythritol kinase [Candidatus Margulisiibacteriota bacterium]
MRLKAFAKVNLTLKILARRPDGYHDLESIMQSVSLCDYISLAPLSSGIRLTTNNQQLSADKTNLAYKAAELFFSESAKKGFEGEGVAVKLEKNIPLAAGLAGGSADAAAVLYGLNKLANKPFTEIELSELGARLGSDVPFCLKGGCCLATGRGDRLSARPIEKNSYILVVPQVEVSTPWAYQEFDRIAASEPLLIDGHRNDLQPVVVRQYPVIQEVISKLIESGCEWAQMSGSGPSVFGLVREPNLGRLTATKIRHAYPRTFFVETVEAGVENEPHAKL